MPESCLGWNVLVEQIRLSITTFDLRLSSLGDEFACAIQYEFNMKNTIWPLEVASQEKVCYTLLEKFSYF